MGQGTEAWDSFLIGRAASGGMKFQHWNTPYVLEAQPDQIFQTDLHFSAPFDHRDREPPVRGVDQAQKRRTAGVDPRTRPERTTSAHHCWACQAPHGTACVGSLPWSAGALRRTMPAAVLHRVRVPLSGTTGARSERPLACVFQRSASHLASVCTAGMLSTKRSTCAASSDSPCRRSC